MNCADYLVDYLINRGVTDVFGFSGGYIVPFIDALYKRKKEINITKEMKSLFINANQNLYTFNQKKKKD